MRSFYFPLIFGGLFTILSCQNSVENNKDRPDAVQFVGKSPELDMTERGIDAIPEEIAIFFEWFQPAAYKICYVNLACGMMWTTQKHG